jgi:hypothetical protein
MRRLRGCLGVGAIFLFGVIFGMAVSLGIMREEMRRAVEGGPEKVAEVVVVRLRKELHLDQSQEEMLQQSMVDTRIKLAAIRQKTQPEVAVTLDEGAQRIRGILNADQVKKFDEIVGKARQRWKLDRAPIGEGAPPPAPEAAPPPATPAPASP